MVSFVALLSLLAAISTAGNTGRNVYRIAVFPREVRVRALAYMRSARNVGYTLGALAGGIALAIGTRQAIMAVPILTGGLLVLNAVMVSRLPPIDRPEPAGPPSDDEDATPGAAGLAQPRLRQLSVCNGVLNSNQVLLNVVVPLWLVERTDAPHTLLAWLFGTNTVMAVLLQVRASRGSETVDGALRAVRLSGWAFILSCLVIGVTHETVGWVSIVLIWLGHVTITGAELWQSAADWGFQSELSDHRRLGDYQGVWGLGYQAQPIIFPGLFTFLALQWGEPGWAVIAVIGVAAAARLAPGGAGGPAVPGARRSAPYPDALRAKARSRPDGHARGMDPADWLLTRAERGNPSTVLDDRHDGDQAWSTGNLVRPLIHGATYFPALYDAIEAARPGDLVLFTDWQGDADERLTGEPGSEVVEVLGRADERGVDVRGLVWRSHTDQTGFFATENRHLGEQLQQRGAEVLLDMRVRTGGSHHQKFVVIRYRDDPSRDVAFVGGMDLAHNRRDDADHEGDPQPQALTEEYGDAPALARRPGRDPRTRRLRRGDRLPRALGGPDAALAQPGPQGRRPVAPPRHVARRPSRAVAAAAAPRVRTRCSSCGPTRTSGMGRDYPFAQRRGAQRRARLLQGDRAGGADRLRRGPVLLGPWRRRPVRGGAERATPSCVWSW